VSGLALTILVVLALVRQARRGGEYALFYLLAMGHDTLFVAEPASLNWFYGLSVNPSGILSACPSRNPAQPGEAKAPSAPTRGTLPACCATAARGAMSGPRTRVTPMTADLGSPHSPLAR